MSNTSKYSYEIIETTEYVEECGNVIVYGISCQAKQPSSNCPEGSHRCQVTNISTRPDFVKELLEKLILHDADPVHLTELVCDHLQ